VNGKNIFTGLGGGNDRFAELIAGRMAATLDGMPATRLIDQNPAHRFRCRAKKNAPGPSSVVLDAPPRGERKLRGQAR